MASSQYLLKGLQSVTKLQLIEAGYVNNLSIYPYKYSSNINVTNKLYNAIPFHQEDAFFLEWNTS